MNPNSGSNPSINISIGRDSHGNPIGFVGRDFNNYVTKHDLASAAAEIQQLLEQLAKNNPTIVQSDDRGAVERAIHEEIKRNPTIKERLLSAVKVGGTEALKVALDTIFKNPAVSISVETIRGFLEAE